MEKLDDELVWRIAAKSEVMDEDQTKTLLIMVDTILNEIVREPDSPAIAQNATILTVGSLQPVELARQSSLDGRYINLALVNETLADVGILSPDDVQSFIVNLGGKDKLVSICKGVAFDITEEAKKGLLEKLSPWSIPSYIIGHSEITLDAGQSTTEKELVKAVQHLYESGSIDAHAVFPKDRDSNEWTEKESQIRSVLSTVSGIPEDDIEKDNTIQQLGLDSISVIRVASELRKRNIVIGVAKILQAGTISNIAMVASKPPTKSGGMNTVSYEESSIRLLDFSDTIARSGISKGDIAEAFPASPGQVYMTSCWQNSGGALYMPTFTYKINTELDHNQFRIAISALTDELPILRTILVDTNREDFPLVQAVVKNDRAKTRIAWEDIDDGEDVKLASRVEAELRKRPNVKVPMVRFTVLSGERKSYMLLTIHHALYDGVSLSMIVQRLQQLYFERVTPKGAQSTVFKEFVGRCITLDNPAVKNFWKTYLAGSKPFTSIAPTLRPESKDSPRTQLYKPGSYPYSARLQNLARTHHLSLQSLLLAAYAQAHVSRLSSDLPELIIGIYNANRLIEIESDMGASYPTLNIVPLRIRSPGKLEVLELARNIQSDLAEIAEGKRGLVGLHEIAMWTGVRIDTFFNYVKFEDAVEKEVRGVMEGDYPEFEIVEVDGVQSVKLWNDESEMPLKGNTARNYIEVRN